MARYGARYERYTPTAAEYAELPNIIASELRRASQSSARITYVDPEGLLTTPTILKAMASVVSEWSRTAVREKGAVSIDVGSVPPAVFAVESIRGLLPLDQLRATRNRMNLLNSYLAEMEKQPGSALVIDPETGSNLKAARQVFNDAEISLNALPQTWSKDNLQLSDALGLPQSSFSSRVFDPELVKGQDYLIGLDFTIERINLVLADAQSIQQHALGKVATDPETGFSARDLVRLLTDLRDVEIETLRSPITGLGIGRDLDMLKLFYRSKLGALKRERQTLSNRAIAINEASRNYLGLVREKSIGADGNGNASGSTAFVPQLGDAFLDRLLELGGNSNEQEFRQGLVQRSIGLREESIGLDAEIARIEAFLKRVDDHQNQPATPTRQRLQDLFSKRVTDQLPQALAKLQNYTDILQRLARRIRYVEEISRILGTTEGNLRSPDYYLQDAVTHKRTFEPLLAKLASIAGMTNRIGKRLNAEVFGANVELFRALSEPEVDAVAWSKSRALLILILTGVFALLVSLLITYFKPIIIRSSIIPGLRNT